MAFFCVHNLIPAQSIKTHDCEKYMLFVSATFDSIPTIEQNKLYINRNQITSLLRLSVFFFTSTITNIVY